jgi:hypothetical protein
MTANGDKCNDNSREEWANRQSSQCGWQQLHRNTGPKQPDQKRKSAGPTS